MPPIYQNILNLTEQCLDLQQKIIDSKAAYMDVVYTQNLQDILLKNSQVLNIEELDSVALACKVMIEVKNKMKNLLIDAIPKFAALQAAGLY